ncbi:MAG TPA: hypothetical protein VKZ63_02635 [Kofleriaceae bacterium]|nr:hypothetical protein [Kofleriaceae bacterium]
MKALLALPLFALGLVAAAPDAEAVSAHERVEAKPITKGGEVVGLRLKLTLRPDSSGYDTVRIGIGPNNGTRPSDHRGAASDPSKGYLLHQFPEVKGLKANTPKEVTVEVLYKDVPNLKPGSAVEVITAWSGPHNPGYWHVYGMQSIQADKASVITLPQSKASQAQQQNLGRSPRARAARRLSAAKRKLPTYRKNLRKSTTARTSTARKSTVRARSRARAR